MSKAAAALNILIIIVYVVVVFLLLYLENKHKNEIIDAQKYDYEMKMESLKEGQEILISQIQPHFIYNVLNTIKYLCKRNPNEAINAIDKFSMFLRTSMDTFSSTECIPLEQEMDIVKNYVYLEKCRFGDKVEVIYDINYKDFCVPSLSVQPMVENAIKHGITKNIGGGKVWISTYEDEKTNFIEIRDNGVGFYVDSTKSNDGKSHIGIKNTAKRIENMSNGKLSIESEPENFTRVLIEIPKESVK